MVGSNVIDQTYLNRVELYVSKTTFGGLKVNKVIRRKEKNTVVSI